MDSDKKKRSSNKSKKVPTLDLPKVAKAAELSPTEFYGPKGPEPTRYGDWEQKGRCTDF